MRYLAGAAKKKEEIERNRLGTALSGVNLHCLRRVSLSSGANGRGPPFWGVRGPKTPFLGGFGGVPGGSGGASNALETTKKSRKIGILAPPKRAGGRDGGKISAEIPSLEFSPRY